MNNNLHSGRLTKDAELKFIGNNKTPLVEFSLAVNNRRKVGEKWEDVPVFLDYKMWGQRGEKLTQYLTKGTFVIVDSEVYQESWEKDGEKRTKLVYNVKNVELGPRSGNGSPKTETEEIPVSAEDIPF